MTEGVRDKRGKDIVVVFCAFTFDVVIETIETLQGGDEGEQVVLLLIDSAFLF